MYVKELTSIWALATNDVVEKTRFELEVPTLPSHKLVLPSDFKTRNQVAVPVALALVSDEMAFAVAIPPDAAPNAVDPKRNSARRVCVETAVSASAAWVPS